MNNHRLVVSAAFASVLSMGLVSGAQAADDAMARAKGKGKVFRHRQGRYQRLRQPVGQPLREPRAEAVLVVRRNWRPQWQLLDPAEADWAEALLAGASLASALERAGASFDFARWFATALRENWLRSASRHCG